MKNCVVIIPVHQLQPLENALLSFNHCFKVLAEHTIIVLAPQGLDLTAYRTVHSNFTTVEIDPIWQSSIENYNLLKRSLFFYDLFKEYEYLLTYELDAYVFADELQFWCDKKFDYIGSPWFEGYDEPGSNPKIIGVGNSGFSLRNIQSCRSILHRIEAIRKFRKYWFQLHFQSLFNYEKLLLKIGWLFKLKTAKYISDFIFESHLNEDYFWSIVVPESFGDYEVAPVSDAIAFGFEVCPELLFEQNNYKLPFGCHAWEKYNPTFWKRHISFT